MTTFEKNNTKFLWIAVILMFTVVLIPVSLIIFTIIYKNMKEKNQLGISLEFLEEQHKRTMQGYDIETRKVEKDLAEMYANREKLIQEYKEQAKLEASQEMAEIEDVLPGLYSELSELKVDIAKSQSTLNSNITKTQKLQTMYKSLKFSFDRFKNSAILDDFDILRDVDKVLSATVEMRLHYMDLKELRSLFNKNKSVIKSILKSYQDRYTTKTNKAIYNLMVLALEAELQNVLYNLKYSALDKAIKDIQAMTAKYQSIASDGNQSIAPTISKFVGEIEYLYIEAVKIEYEYYVKKEAAKEEQRALREQMRQESEERKQLEIERKRIEAEEEKFKNELKNLMAQLETADSDFYNVLQERINEVNQQLENVEHKKEDIAKLQHGKAGYVYVISNLGSFGDDIFKIGMTRRLEPFDRISELSGASVPFPFDVHSFIFSDNAVDLENSMHKSLHNNRVNKINLRKEFFKISIEELEKLVFELQPTAEFVNTMLAEQFKQGLSLDDIPDDWVIVGTEENEDDYEIIDSISA